MGVQPGRLTSFACTPEERRLAVGERPKCRRRMNSLKEDYPDWLNYSGVYSQFRPRPKSAERHSGRRKIIGERLLMVVQWDDATIGPEQ